MSDIMRDRQLATAALLTHVADNAPPAAGSGERAELGKTIANRIQTIDERQSALRDSHRQNQLLIGLLALFVVVQILLLEYRWLVRPIVRIAAVLQTGQATGQSTGHATGQSTWRELAAYAPRRDEIGVFAQALMNHFQLVHRQQETASLEQAGLSERLSRQEGFRRESMSFQASIAEIVQRLEGHAGRMSVGVEKSGFDLIAGRRARGGIRPIDGTHLGSCRRGRRRDSRYCHDTCAGGR